MDDQPTPIPQDTEFRRVMERHAQAVRDYDRIARRIFSDDELTESPMEGPNIEELQNNYVSDMQNAINQAFVSDGSTNITVSPQSRPNIQLIDPVPAMQETYAHVMQYYSPPAGNWLNWEVVEQTLGKLRKKRVSRIKKSATNAEIAKAMAKPTKKLAEGVGQQVTTVAATIKQHQDVLLKKNKVFDRAARRLKIYIPAVERLEKKEEEILLEFEKMVAQARDLPLVDYITIDGRGRIVVTTKLLYTKHEHWKRRRNIGVYQIRIDFTRANPAAGVDVLNTTRRFQNYDSPTISSTNMCTGNFWGDLKRDFYTQNLPELIQDTIDYIQSPNTRAGYIGLNGDKNKAWDAFLKDAKPMPKGFDFAVYDREYSSGENAERLESGSDMDTLEDVGEILQGGRDELQESRRTLEWAQTRMREQDQEIDRLSFRIRTNAQNVLWYAIENMSIREELREYYFRLFQQRGFDRREEEQYQIYDIELSSTVERDVVLAILEYRSEERRGTRRVRFYIPLEDFFESTQRQMANYPPRQSMWHLRAHNMQLIFEWRQSRMVSSETPQLDDTFVRHVVNVPSIEPQRGMAGRSQYYDNILSSTTTWGMTSLGSLSPYATAGIEAYGGGGAGGAIGHFVDQALAYNVQMQARVSEENARQASQPAVAPAPVTPAEGIEDELFEVAVEDPGTVNATM